MFGLQKLVFQVGIGVGIHFPAGLDLMEGIFPIVRRLYDYHDPHDPSRSFMDLPTPVVKVYFAMVHMDSEVGPPRFVPGTHHLTAKQDVPALEPPSISLVCPAGTAIMMDPWPRLDRSRSFGQGQLQVAKDQLYQLVPLLYMAKQIL